MPYADPVARQRYNRDYKRANRWRYRPAQKVYDAAKHANERAAAAGVPGTISPADAAKVFASGPCVYCGTYDDLSLDHWIALSVGGPNILENLLPACRSCNASKHQGDAPHRWAWRHDACVGCGTTERRHFSGGLCTACYSQFRIRQRRECRAAREGLQAAGH